MAQLEKPEFGIPRSENEGPYLSKIFSPTADGIIFDTTIMEVGKPHPFILNIEGKDRLLFVTMTESGELDCHFLEDE